jgi:hypothetical protein
VTLTTIQPSLVALFDNDLPPPGLGDPLPPCWHIAACSTPVPSCEIGFDGHLTVGILTPPPDPKRRMFASGTLTISHHLRVGEAVQQLDRNHWNYRQDRALRAASVASGLPIVATQRTHVRGERRSRRRGRGRHQEQHPWPDWCYVKSVPMWSALTRRVAVLMSVVGH